MKMMHILNLSAYLEFGLEVRREKLPLAVISVLID
jgi:hypothetical protein